MEDTNHAISKKVPCDDGFSLIVDLVQRGWQGGTLTESNWRELVRERLRLLDWNAILYDVRPFVEPGFDLSLLTLEQVVGE